ncbi:MAG TPA: hypothetical protein VH397_17340 [Xanthobacteraceae bacterium]|jgi:hypothetical protein
MHPIGAKNKYIGVLFMKMSKEYFALGRKGIHDVSAGHVKDLSKYSNMLTHVVTIGTDARYDQVTLIEGDTLEDLYNATADFRLGAKGQYIDIVDCVVGIKAPPRARATRR